MNAGRRHFGQKRLEHKVVVGVNKFDIELAPALPFEGFGGKNATEAAADHEDFLVVRGLGHGSLSVCLEVITTLLRVEIKAR
jgi:hypothetical protein